MRFVSWRSIPKPVSEALSVEVGGRDVAVAVKRNARARRLILRIDSRSGLPVVTLPARTPLAQGDVFLRKNRGWLEARLDRQPEPAPFCDGSAFILRGESCRIVHRRGGGLVRVETIEGGRVLSVSGDARHIGRRVTDWLKREARRDLAAAAARHAAALGRKPKAIGVGDAKSRWGSCSAAGVLTFSWRLVLAPPAVLDYLAAHEVAHLAQMNHGPAFWALVARLDPDFKAAQGWLKRNGAGLYAVGREP